jgi:hypothetical protein
MEGMGGVKGTNDLVDGMEQDTSSNQVAEVINVDIGVAQGEGVRLATGDGSRGKGAGMRGTAGREGHATGDAKAATTW